VFQPVDSHSLLVFWAQVLVLLACAQGLGALLGRIGQPPVIGALATGLLLGPSVFGALWPEGWQWLFPADPRQDAMLQGVAWIGVSLLLVVTGFETDLPLLRRLGRAALFVAAGSLLLPFGAGLCAGLLIPDSFLGESAPPLLFALFMATAMAISALPVIAKILSELDLMRRNVGQLTLAAGTANDLVGWTLLGTIVGVAHSGSFALSGFLLRLAIVAGFLVLALTLGQRGVDWLLRETRRRGAGVRGMLSLTLLVAVALGLTTHAIGLEVVFGAYLAGALLGRSKFQNREIPPFIDAVTMSFFAPLFFATAGLRADLGRLTDPTVLLWSGIVLAVASGSKFAGAYFGARLGGLHPREGFALGAALNARGAVELVIATVGLSVGVLNRDSYTIVVLLALVTSMMAPPLLRAAMAGFTASAEEAERLDRERILRGNLLVRPAPILLPSHGGPNSLLAARILDLAWPEGTRITLLSAGAGVPDEDVARVRAVFAQKPVQRIHARARDPRAAVLEEVSLGYGALFVGATDRAVAGRVVTPFVDDVLASSPIPVVLVRGGTQVRDPEQQELFRRVLVPAIGTQPGRAAQEVAFGIARSAGAEVLLAHVVTTPAAPDDTTRAAEEVVEQALRFAAQMGVTARTAIRLAVSVPLEILSLAREADADLIVLPANLRQLSGRPFLGHGVEYILEHAESTVVVVTAPPGPRH
jgi:Kef-type K+ transport system membrane component KefB/nucleotide-binding universal stress UspA family protein